MAEAFTKVPRAFRGCQSHRSVVHRRWSDPTARLGLLQHPKLVVLETHFQSPGWYGTFSITEHPSGWPTLPAQHRGEQGSTTRRSRSRSKANMRSVSLSSVGSIDPLCTVRMMLTTTTEMKLLGRHCSSSRSLYYLNSTFSIDSGCGRYMFAKEPSREISPGCLNSNFGNLVTRVQPIKPMIKVFQL